MLNGSYLKHKTMRASLWTYYKSYLYAYSGGPVVMSSRNADLDSILVRVQELWDLLDKNVADLTREMERRARSRGNSNERDTEQPR